MRLYDQVIISIVTGICLVSLIAVLKSVLLISPDVLSSDVIVYVIIYIGFITTLSARDRTQKEFKYDTPKFWSMLIVLITIAIIAYYAL